MAQKAMTTGERRLIRRMKRNMVSVRQIRLLTGYSLGAISKYTGDLPDVAPRGRKPLVNKEEAIRLLQLPGWNPARVAEKLGVARVTIYHMIERMLESTVEDGGQI